MKHLVSLTDSTAEQITALLDLAEQMAASKPAPQSLAGRHIANIFFEPSTRTRASFELAAQRLGGHVVSLDMNNSSYSKGESLTDTYRTLQSMGFDALVVRTADAGVPTTLSRLIGHNAAVINAGEANVAHPTQGLLDALTIRQHKPDFKNLSIAIVGDIAHSRVARSTLRVLDMLGCQDMRVIAPFMWQPHAQEIPKAIVTEDMRLGLQGCDVVMALRIQNERLGDGERPNRANYINRFRLDATRLAFAKSNAIVMHPGPMNRDVEISNDVADGRQSVIWQQVRNGVHIRAAVFDTIARGRGWSDA